MTTEPDRRAAFAAAEAALAASGTVSLELAANDVPMVIAYDMAWISRIVVTRLLRVDSVTLVNLVSGQDVVPEFLGRSCRPSPVGAAFEHLLADPAARNAQRAGLRETMVAWVRVETRPGSGRAIGPVAGGQVTCGLRASPISDAPRHP